MDLVIDENPFSAGRMVRGVAAFGRKRGWRYTMRPESLPDLVASLQRSQAQGIIAASRLSVKAVETLAQSRPVIYVLDGIGEAVVRLDEEAIGRAGAEHLVEQGFRRFAYCGVSMDWSVKRYAGFEAALRKRGITPTTTLGYRCEAGTWPGWYELMQGDWLRSWAGTLQLPVAVMACHDYVAASLLDACLARGLRVPEDVAILGVDNNELRCDYNAVTLSSVDPDLEAVGRRAAEVLDAMLRGERPVANTMVVRPKGVVVRQSTELLAFGDDTVNDALRFIRDRAADGISVADVLGRVGVSRSALERKFAHHLGRSPGDEIRRVRMNVARELLLDTNLPLAEIADQTGFDYLSHFSKAFRDAFGESPRKYRQLQRR